MYQYNVSNIKEILTLHIEYQWNVFKYKVVKSDDMTLSKFDMCSPWTLPIH